MMRWANLFLIVLLMGSALALVTARFAARDLFLTLDRLQNQARVLDTDWRSLQLARAFDARHARIDRVAREQLKMVPRTPERVLYLKPGEQP